MTHAWSQWVGRVVNGEFQLQKYLGGSDQSAVFLTEHQGQEPPQVAIKLLSADAVNGALQLDRWRLAKSPSHPHLIRILQTGTFRLEAEDLIFVVMEYAEENLAQILPERPLTPAEVGQMLEPALDALSYLHSQGLAHGRLQPANIMAMNDQLKLSSDHVGKAGELFSGPGKRSPYDPPEERSSPAGDMWSLGMTLAQVLTQRLPSWNELDQKDPALPDGIPVPFYGIVRGCLRRDPQSRLTIADIAAQLQFRLQSYPPPPARPLAHPTPAPPSSPPSALSKDVKPVRLAQKPSKLRLFALLAVLLAVLGRLMMPSAGRKQALPAAERQNAQTEKTGGSEGNTNGQQPVIELRRVAPASRTEPSPSPSGSAAPVATSRSSSADSEVIHRVLPDVSPAAQSTIQGTVKVRVRVQVDRSGNVVAADFDSQGPSKYFARLSMQAAQSWKFAPTDQDERREFLLRFDFTNSGTKAFATRAGR